MNRLFVEHPCQAGVEQDVQVSTVRLCLFNIVILLRCMMRKKIRGSLLRKGISCPMEPTGGAHALSGECEHPWSICVP